MFVNCQLWWGILEESIQNDIFYQNHTPWLSNDWSILLCPVNIVCEAQVIIRHKPLIQNIDKWEDPSILK